VRASATSRIVSSTNLPTAQAKAGAGKTDLAQLFSQMLEQAAPQQATKPLKKNAQDTNGAQPEDQAASATQNSDSEETQTAAQTLTAAATTGKLIDKLTAKTSTNAGSSAKTAGGNDKFAAWFGSDTNTITSTAAPQSINPDPLPAVQVAAQQRSQGAFSNSDQTQAVIAAASAATSAALPAGPATTAAASNLAAVGAGQVRTAQDGQESQPTAANAQAQGQVPSQNLVSSQAASGGTATSGSSPPATDQARSRGDQTQTQIQLQGQNFPTGQATAWISTSISSGADLNQSTQNIAPADRAGAGSAKAQSQVAQTVSADQTITLPSTDQTDAQPETISASPNISNTIASLPGTNQSGKPVASKVQDAGNGGTDTGKAQAFKTYDSRNDPQSSAVNQDPAPDQSSAVASDTPVPKQDPAQNVSSDSTNLTITPSQAQTATPTTAPALDQTAQAAQTAQTTAQSTALHVSSLAVEISAKSLSGAKQFDIRLDPPELGQVDVRLSIDATGKVRAHLSADQPQTLHLLQKDAPTLTRALRDAGLNVSQNGLNFSLRQQSGGGASAGQGQGKSRSFMVSANNSIEATPVADYRGLVDGRLDIRV